MNICNHFGLGASFCFKERLRGAEKVDFFKFSSTMYFNIFLLDRISYKFVIDICPQTMQVGSSLTFLIYAWEEPGCIISPNTNHPDCGFSCFSSVPQDKYRIVNYAGLQLFPSTSFPIHIYCYPIIKCYVL
jgi:hypothetical protein